MEITRGLEELNATWYTNIHLPEAIDEPKSLAHIGKKIIDLLEQYPYSSDLTLCECDIFLLPKSH